MFAFVNSCINGALLSLIQLPGPVSAAAAPRILLALLHMLLVHWVGMDKECCSSVVETAAKQQLEQRM